MTWNVGWTLGNDCPYRCTHCYSFSARNRGMDLEDWMVERIVGELVSLPVETVNLGGNEPIFTNGLKIGDSKLPLILEKLHENNVATGITSAGITIERLKSTYPGALATINDIDISLDSPFEEEHDLNRGARIFRSALRALRIAQELGIPRTIVMCGMRWNFTKRHFDSLLSLAKEYGSNIRINPVKPVESKHMELVIPVAQYFEGFKYLMENTIPIDLGEPPLATLAELGSAKGCPCGTYSFRIHSITPDGRVPVSPCVYLHDYKSGDLLTESLKEITSSISFQEFRKRRRNPDRIKNCADIECGLIKVCRGGCASRAYLHNYHESGKRSLYVKDPYCPAETTVKLPKTHELSSEKVLVHRNYLCTWIGKPC